DNSGIGAGRAMLSTVACKWYYLDSFRAVHRKRPNGRFFCSMSDLAEHVEKQIEKIATSEGLELVHIDYHRQGRGFLLRVDIDKEGGVTLGDCEMVSQQISAFL